MLTLYCAVVGKAGGAFDVNIDKDAPVSALKRAIKEEKPNDLKYVDANNLRLFLAKQDSAWLPSNDPSVIGIRSGSIPTEMEKLLCEEKEIDPTHEIEDVFGSELPKKTIHVLVVIPPQAPPQCTLAPTVQIPEFTPLDNSDQYLAECSLDRWKAGEVRDIPLIWQFMEPLGGCTTKKKFFWRKEEKQVVSILLNGWFPEPSLASSSALANKRSILVGSPGIGKSTLFCLMAFYLVLKYKKNVLVYRRFTEVDQESCLLYLGYQDGKIVYFTLQNCLPERVVAIYEELKERQDFSNVWLLLDGIYYERVPPGLNTFKMLATSQQPDVKGSAYPKTYRCLLPCWKKRDLFELGKEVYSFEEKDMEDRFYYSGGSIREFADDTEDHLTSMSRHISIVCSQSENPQRLLSNPGTIERGKSQIDRLRHTFVKDIQNPDNYLNSSHWEQFVDSQYAVTLLSQKVEAQKLLDVFHWARGAGHGALAGIVFENFMHRLAADNFLILHVAEYVVKPRNKRPKLVTWQLIPKGGRSLSSSTAMSSTQLPKDLHAELTGWRDNGKFSYWFPLIDNFPNIDSIVKLEPTTSRLGGGVAYLQITTASTHKIDGEQLKNLGGIFTRDGVDPPIYIALCPDRKTCEDLRLTTEEAVDVAKTACKVYVGFYEERPQKDAKGPRDDAPNNNELRTGKRARKNVNAPHVGDNEELARPKSPRGSSSGRNLRPAPKQTMRTKFIRWNDLGQQASVRGSESESDDEP